jgi:diguanylate cyclase (GGDEF)-like protein
VVEDIEKSDLDINPVLKKEGIRFVAAVKLVGNETLLGILYIDDFKPRNFSEFDRKTLEMFANIAGLALEKFRLIEQTRQLALTDGLTGLYNHRYLHERLGQEISRARRTGKSMSVLLIDVDNFKKYNDANGHLAGDDALKKIASIIRDNIRHGDVASRYGGEEFVVLLYDAKKEDAMKVAERIRSMVEGEYFLGEENLPSRKLTVSIGIAAFPEDSETKDMLLKKADDAMYEAKLRGKNRIVCAGEED